MCVVVVVVVVVVDDIVGALGMIADGGVVYVGVCVRSVATKTSLVNRLQLAVQRQETHASSGHRARCTVQRRTGHHHVVSTSHLHEDGEYCSFIETFI